MTILQKQILKSVKELHRGAIDLMRAVALFVPDESPLAQAVESALSSLLFSPREMDGFFMRRFLSELNYLYPEDQIATNAPWWLQVVCIILNGGDKGSQELFEIMQAKYGKQPDDDGHYDHHQN